MPATGGRGRLLTPREAAAYLRLNPRTVVRLAREGKLAGRKVGNRWRFEEEALRNRPGAEINTSDYGGPETRLPVRMSLANLLAPGLVVLDLKADNRRAALTEMVSRLVSAGFLRESEPFVRLLEEREDLMSTCISDGVAIPHPRRASPGMFADSHIVAAMSRTGVNFGGGGSPPVRLFLMICAKDDRSHLQILARLSQLLNNTPVVTRLVTARTADDVVRIVGEEEAALSRQGVSVAV